MKVMLMVQNGNGRPRCAWVNKSAKRVARCYHRDESRNAGSWVVDLIPVWWLVEAESAEAARSAIARFEDGHRDATHGRILASGGRER